MFRNKTKFNKRGTKLVFSKQQKIIERNYQKLKKLFVITKKYDIIDITNLLGLFCRAQI